MTDKQPEALIRAEELEQIGAESSLARAMAAHTIRLLYKENEALRARLAQPEPEPVAWMHDSHVGFNVPLYTAPPHFIDPAKVARLMDEAFERGKKEIDMEQVKDIAQKLADCALLNSAPPQREWQGLTDDEILEEYRQSYGDDGDLTDVYFARAIETKLKEKNA